MANHLTPEELSKELGIDRQEVIKVCVQEGVPIYQSKIDKTLDPFDQRVARLVGLERVRVGNRQHGDVDRLEGLGFVTFVHASIVTILACRSEASGLNHAHDRLEA